MNTRAVFSIGALLVVGSCTADGDSAPLRPDFPYPSRSVQVGDQRVHYVEVGTGSPIVLVHGNPTWSYVWRHVIPALAEHGRVVAVDLVGFGESARPTPATLDAQLEYFEGFIEGLGLEGVVLVAHDWGSYFGFRYALAHPENVRGIAFLEAHLPNAAGVPTVPPGMSERFEAVMSAFAELGGADGEARILDDNAFVEDLLPLSLTRELTEDELEAYRAPFRERDARRHILNLRQAVTSPPHLSAMRRYSEWLASSPFPLLMIHAVPGAVATDRQVAWVEQNLPTATIVNAGRSFHFLQEDLPEEVGRAVIEWLERERLLGARGQPGAP